MRLHRLVGDVLENRPTNTAIGLQGQIRADHYAYFGRPGDEDMTIQLRGASSTNKVEPLVIIDEFLLSAIRNLVR